MHRWARRTCSHTSHVHAEIWVTNACACIEVDISLFLKWPCGTIRASPTQKHTAGGAAKGNFFLLENWNKITGITTSRQETVSVLLGHFHEHLCQGDSRRENRIGSTKLLRPNKGFPSGQATMHFSKAAALISPWFPSWISSYSSDTVIFSIHSSPLPLGVCSEVLNKNSIHLKTTFCISPFLSRKIDVTSLRSPGQASFSNTDCNDPFHTHRCTSILVRTFGGLIHYPAPNPKTKS